MPEDAGQIIKLAAMKISGGIFRQIYESAGKHIWITASSFLLEFDGQNLKTYGAEQGLTWSLITIAEDISGNMRFGGRNGATRMKRFGMSAFGQADGLDSAAIHSLYSRNFPPDFFNVNSPRGVIFNAIEDVTGAALNQFAVSANSASGVPVRFGNLNASYTSILQTFSPQRLFIARRTRIMERRAHRPRGHRSRQRRAFPDKQRRRERR